MGVILRQGAKTSVVKLVGTIIGMVSLLLIYPLNHEAYGKYQFLFSTAMLFTPIIGLGLPQIVIKYFSSFGNRLKDVRSILPTVLTMSITSFFLIITIFFFFGEVILSKIGVWGFDVDLWRKEKWWLVSISFLLTVNSIIINYISNFERIVVPTIINGIGQKIFTPLVILLIVVSSISIDHISCAILIYCVLVLLSLIIYMMRLDIINWKPDFTYFQDVDKRKELANFGFFSSLSGLGNMFAFRIDSIMITTLLGAVKNGLYFNILIIATVIDIPYQSISKIASPIIAKSWESRDIKEIDKIYKQTSILGQIIGSFIFLGIWASIDQLILLSSKPEIFIGAKQIFVILGATKLIDAVMGLNSQIIAYSSFYKYNLLFLSLLGVLSVITNYLFIPKYGVIGASYSTFISLAIFNVVKLLFIKYKVGIQPFTKGNAWVLFIFLITGFIVSFIPDFGNTIFLILTKSLVVTLIFIPLIYKSKVSEDFNNLLQSKIGRLKR